MVVFDGLLTFILMPDDLILMSDDLILGDTHLRQGCRNLIEHLRQRCRNLIRHLKVPFTREESCMGFDLFIKGKEKGGRNYTFFLSQEAPPSIVPIRLGMPLGRGE